MLFKASWLALSASLRSCLSQRERQEPDLYALGSPLGRAGEERSDETERARTLKEKSICKILLIFWNQERNSADAFLAVQVFSSSHPTRSGRVRVSSEQWGCARFWSSAMVCTTSWAISRMAVQSSGRSVWLRPEWVNKILP